MSQQFQSPTSTVQDHKVYFELVIHALSRYHIYIHPERVEIQFVMENHKDVNLSRVKNIQTVIISKVGLHKLFSYISNTGQEVFLCSVNNVFDETEFKRIQKTLVDNILLVINMNTKIGMLKRQKKKLNDNLDRVQRKEFTSQIKSFEKAASTYRKNIKSVLHGLF